MGGRKPAGWHTGPEIPGLEEWVERQERERPVP